MPVEYFDTSEISELPKYFDDLEYSDVSEYSVSFFFFSSKIFAFIKYVLLLLVIAGLAGGIQSQKNYIKVT